MLKRIVSGIMLTLLTVGMLTLAFNIQPVKASGTIYIRADGSVDPPTAPIQRDGDLYTLTDNISSDADGIVIERDNIVVDGAGYTVQGTGLHESKGIDLTGRQIVTVRNTQIKNFYSGIYLYRCFNNGISGNNVADNYLGIWLYYLSNNNGIIGNNVTNNNYGGIGLYDSINNNISGNNVTANNVDGIRVHSSSNNIIYHNNFIDNSEQVYNYDSTNFWDDGYPSGGNHWSDYSDRYPSVVDEYHGENQDVLGSDEIWDGAYEIDADNQDTYPLVEPWTPQKLEGDVNRDNIVNVKDLTIVSLSYGSFCTEPDYNRKADLNYDCVVDMKDLSTVARNLCNTYP